MPDAEQDPREKAYLMEEIGKYLQQADNARLQELLVWLKTREASSKAGEDLPVEGAEAQSVEKADGAEEKVPVVQATEQVLTPEAARERIDNEFLLFVARNNIDGESGITLKELGDKFSYSAHNQTGEVIGMFYLRLLSNDRMQIAITPGWSEASTFAPLSISVSPENISAVSEYAVKYFTDQGATLPEGVGFKIDELPENQAPTTEEKKEVEKEITDFSAQIDMLIGLCEKYQAVPNFKESFLLQLKQSKSVLQRTAGELAGDRPVMQGSSIGGLEDYKGNYKANIRRIFETEKTGLLRQICGIDELSPGMQYDPKFQSGIDNFARYCGAQYLKPKEFNSKTCNVFAIEPNSSKPPDSIAQVVSRGVQRGNDVIQKAKVVLTC